MIIETIIGLVGVAAAYVTGRNTAKPKKTPPTTELSEEAKLAEFALRPIVSDEQFNKIKKLIKDYSLQEQGCKSKNITDSTYPDSLVERVISEGYRFTCKQLADLLIIRQVWCYSNGLADNAGVRVRFYEKTKQGLSAKVEAEETIAKILGSEANVL